MRDWWWDRSNQLRNLSNKLSDGICRSTGMVVLLFKSNCCGAIAGKIDLSISVSTGDRSNQLRNLLNKFSGGICRSTGIVVLLFSNSCWWRATGSRLVSMGDWWWDCSNQLRNLSNKFSGDICRSTGMVLLLLGSACGVCRSSNLFWYHLYQLVAKSSPIRRRISCCWGIVSTFKSWFSVVTKTNCRSTSNELSPWIVGLIAVTSAEVVTISPLLRFGRLWSINDQSSNVTAPTSAISIGYLTNSTNSNACSMLISGVGSVSSVCAGGGWELRLKYFMLG